MLCREGEILCFQGKLTIASLSKNYEKGLAADMQSQTCMHGPTHTFSVLMCTQIHAVSVALAQSDMCSQQLMDTQIYALSNVCVLMHLQATCKYIYAIRTRLS